MSLGEPTVEGSTTVEELLALPDDGRRRYLIQGRLRPDEPSLSVRNRRHGRIEATLAKVLGNWRDALPEPRGEVLSGEVGFRLRSGPDSLVGIDVAYASAELVARTGEDASFYDGAPVLAVEILSPSDKHADIVEKIGEYLQAGVVVWEVDPDFRTVRVHRPGQFPESFNPLQELVTEPQLPGFRVAVSEIFA